MNNRIKVSVIVLIKCGGELLEQTLDSIFKQTFKGLEVICVSNDKSIVLTKAIDVYSNESRIIKYSYLEGMNEASGRNFGIQRAQGNYILFVEEGDVLKEDVLSCLYNHIKMQGFDVLYFDGDKHYRRNESYRDSCIGVDLFKDMVDNKEYYASVDLQITSREYIVANSLCFANEVDEEDQAFCLCCIIGAKKAGYLQAEFIQKVDRLGIHKAKKNTIQNICGYFRDYLKIIKWMGIRNIEGICILQLKIILDGLLQNIRQMYVRLSIAERSLEINLKPEEKILFEELVVESIKQKEQIKVSIIVPVYNVQEFVGHCIYSLLMQTLRQIEIIVVNDGTTDDSMHIIEELVEKDVRVVYINKENSGYGDSLNQGIRIARGEYIGILESDDIADPNMFERLYNAAYSINADLAKGNFYNFYSKEQKLQYYELLKRFNYNQLLKEEDKKELLMLTPSIWSGIYKRSFLLDNQIEFLPSPGASYQDIGFAFKTIICAKRIVLVQDGTIYYRRDNDDSSVKDTSKVYCVCDEFAEIFRFMEEHQFENYFPIYAKTKFYRYSWNLNRLSGKKKADFKECMKKEFLDMESKGWLKKEYWSINEWETLAEIREKNQL